MKTAYLRMLLAAVAVSATLASCDHIASDDRFIEMPAVEARRVVLLEEFTGQKCIKCPAAHEVIESLMGQYAGNLVAVSIHAGPLSIPDTQFMGLATAEGQYYADKADVKVYPSGIVDRMGGPTTPNLWAGAIYSDVQQPSMFDLSLKAAAADGRLDVTATVMAYETATPRLQLWVVEDGVLGPQSLENGGTDLAYVHNHVFRAAVNGLEGEEVALTAHAKSEVSASIALDKAWKTANLHVVGFLFTADDGVLQACRAKVDAAAAAQ